MLTEDELAAMEARCHAATAGPWQADYAYSSRDDAAHAWGPGTTDLEQAEADAAFIAAARSDVPALLAEVRRLRAIITDYETPLEAHTDAEGRIIGPWLIPPYEG